MVKPRHETKRARMMWGTTRAHINNMVKGVIGRLHREPGDQRRRLSRSGAGQDPAAAAGLFSTRSTIRSRTDIAIKCEKPTSIAISGRDRQRVGQVAAEIRAFRGPEPYKGKGIKYDTETIRRKEGKKK